MDYSNHKCPNTELKRAYEWILTVWCLDDGVESSRPFSVSEKAFHTKESLMSDLSDFDYKFGMEKSKDVYDGDGKLVRYGLLHAQVFVRAKKQGSRVSLSTLMAALNRKDEAGNTMQCFDATSVCKSCPGMSLAKAYDYCGRDDKNLEGKVYKTFDLTERQRTYASKDWTWGDLQRLVEEGKSVKEICKNHSGAGRYFKGLLDYQMFFFGDSMEWRTYYDNTHPF